VKAKERGREADIDHGCAEAASKILCGGRKVPQGRVSFWRAGFLMTEPIFLLLQVLTFSHQSRSCTHAQGD